MPRAFSAPRLRGLSRLVKRERGLRYNGTAMARYRIVCWRDIPSLVEAFEGDEAARRPLSQRFQDLIDAVAMREGASETEAYLEGWAPSPDAERPGGAEAVAEAVASELEAAFEALVARHLRSPTLD